MKAKDDPPRGGKKSDTMAAVKPLRDLARSASSASSEERREVEEAPKDPGELEKSMGTEETLAEGLKGLSHDEAASASRRDGSEPGAADDESGDPWGDVADSDTLPVGDIVSGGRPAVVRQAATPARREGPLGRTIAGRYTILELLGKGGMSEVYVARHELLKKIVAVKVLKEELASSKAALERFHREAIAAAAIGDPHIVDVTDYGFTEEGDAFIVMERLEGSDLRVLLRQEGALAAGRAVAICRQILRGLRAAHACDIIHRDLKAENVFLTTREDQEFVKILDFGISKLRVPHEGLEEGKSSLTSTGIVMGTPQYIAPEQAHAQSDLDHRVDIYAMGVILYEMLTGELPFTGDTALELMMKHVQDPPEPPRRRRPDLSISVELEAVVLKALEKDRDDRFASAQEMLDALPASNALEGGYASIGTAGAAEVTDKRTGWPAILVGVAFLVAGLGYFASRLLGVSSGDAVAVRSSLDGGVAVKGARHDVERAPHVSRALLAQGGRDKVSIDAAVRLDRAPGSDKKDAPASASSPAILASLRVVVHPRGARVIIDGHAFSPDRVLRGPVGRRVHVTVMAKGYRRLTRTIVLKGDRVLELRLRPSNAPKAPGNPEGDLKSNPYG